MTDIITKDREVLFALEGERKPRSLALPATTTALQFLEMVKEATGRIELEEVLIEDEEVAVDGEVVLVERIVIDEFKLVHVATKGKIKVDVVFNGKTEPHSFSPSVTMETIVKWAMGAFKLEGDPSDFQLKHGDEVLAAGQHLGQVAEGKKEVRLSLVMKIKPQG